MPANTIGVVGAGIAGLVAAHELKEGGFNVIVFEANDRVGGRMSTVRVDDCLIDEGAQFLSENYSTLIPLIREVGLGQELSYSKAKAAVIRNGTLRRFTPTNQLSVLLSGYLRPFEILSLIRRAPWLKRNVSGLPLGDYSRWSEFDDEWADLFVRKRFGEGVLEYVIEPQLQGLYYQSPQECSKALALMLFSFAIKRGKILHLRQGMGSLPRALAENLDVRLTCPVQSLHVDPAGVTIESSAGTTHVDKVVLATTASSARHIYRQADALEKAVMSATYSSTINLALATRPGFELPPDFRDVYGVLVPRGERSVIAAIGVETKKTRNRVQDGALLDIMFDGQQSAGLIEKADEDILAECLAELERYIPGVSTAIRLSHLVRWAEAEPRSPVGRSKTLRDYYSSNLAGRRVLLAGDYLGFPHTDSPAFTGKRAASCIMRLRDR